MPHVTASSSWMRRAARDWHLPDSLSRRRSAAFAMEAEWGSPELPMEIIEKILKRVPFPSLMRFRTVSKGWNSLILSPKFARDCQKSSSKPVPVFVRQLTGADCFSLLVLNSDSNRWLLHRLPLPEARLFPLNLTASSGGLLCFDTQDRREFVVINPLTGRLRHVQLPFPPAGDMSLWIKLPQLQRRHILTGLIVDHQAGTFKLIVASLLEKDEKRRTLLYDSADGSWRSGAPLPGGVHFESFGALTSGGNIYGVVRIFPRDNSVMSFKVLKYNVGSDRWCEVALNVRRGSMDFKGIDLLGLRSQVLLVSRRTQFILSENCETPQTNLCSTFYRVQETFEDNTIKLMMDRSSFRDLEKACNTYDSRSKFIRCPSAIAGVGDLMCTHRPTGDRRREVLKFNCGTQECYWLPSVPRVAGEGLDIMVLEPSLTIDL